MVSCMLIFNYSFDLLEVVFHRGAKPRKASELCHFRGLLGPSPEMPHDTRNWTTLIVGRFLTCMVPEAQSRAMVA